MKSSLVRSPAIAATLLLLVGGAVPALAESAAVLSPAELGEASVAVVRGHVYSADAAWGDIDSIYTYVRVDVEEVLAGSGVPESIIVKQLGGVVGRLGQYVGGAPAFRPGEEVVLFLTVRPRDATVYPANYWQGKWTVDRSEGSPVARRHAGFDDAGAEVAPEAVALPDLRAAVAGVAPVARTPRQIQYVPAEAPAPVNTVETPTPRKFSLIGFSWHQAFEGTRTAIDFHRKRQRGVGVGRKQIRRSVRDWNRVKRTINAFKKGKKRGGARTGSAFRADDPAIVLFNEDPNSEISDTSGTLAVGGAWFFTNIKIRKLSEATSGYVVMNDAQRKFLRNKRCYENVLKHEAGHAMGHGHSNRSGQLMSPSISLPACKKRFPLQRDDQRGHRKMYHRRFAR